MVGKYMVGIEKVRILFDEALWALSIHIALTGFIKSGKVSIIIFIVTQTGICEF